ncbi:unnamed protein product [Adineta steineri]|uniref:Uncharacterized protein n=1 Tax=Adineta steineri TaxID=433720 RepID=A0A819PB38_9BILA|nr:unnamed protein product [Adineta steineri]
MKAKNPIIFRKIQASTGSSTKPPADPSQITFTLKDDQHSASTIENTALKFAKEQAIVQSCVNKQCVLSMKDLTQAVETCEKRSKLSQIDFYGSTDNEEMFHIQVAIARLEAKLKPNSNNLLECGNAFHDFFNLLQKPWRNEYLTIITSVLKQNIDATISASDKAVDLPYEKRLTMEIHWRNAIVCYEHMKNSDDQETLISHYRHMIDNGQPFEIIDGDNFHYQSSFLEKVMIHMKGKKLFVMSIVGPQNKGKSTLLNYMFGTLFDVRDGRCTRGMFISFTFLS